MQRPRSSSGNDDQDLQPNDVERVCALVSSPLWDVIPRLLDRQEREALNEIRANRGHPEEHAVVIRSIDHFRTTVRALAAQGDIHDDPFRRP